jgi:hypothetical protein
MDNNEIKSRLMAVPPPVTTTSEAEAHPEWCFGGNPRAIEAQEKRGQVEFVNNQQLPAKCDSALKVRLEAAGVVFGSPTPNDPLFVMAVLPEGWKKKPTDHSMWSELVDDKGVQQALIFYKAAFYDRDAFLSG